MSLLCFIQGHTPSEEQVWNRGYSFSRCCRCRSDMIRSDSEWIVVPAGHKVVWKSGLHEHSRPAGYARNLPILYRDVVRSGVPAHWHGGWYRHVRALVERAALPPAAPAAALALDNPEREPSAFPYVVALAAIAGAGLQLLFADPGGERREQRR
jgi:hypothetical protein